jgi:hypothetical protein
MLLLHGALTLLLICVNIVRLDSLELGMTELNILRPGSGELVSDAAPEVEWNVVTESDFLDGKVSISLDGGSLTTVNGSEGQLSLAGLSDGFHTIEATAIRSGKVIASATTRFLYMMPLDDVGDDEEWQLSWVRSIAYMDRIKTLTSAIADIHAQHLEELAQLKSDLVDDLRFLSARPDTLLILVVFCALAGGLQAATCGRSLRHAIVPCLPAQKAGAMRWRSPWTSRLPSLHTRPRIQQMNRSACTLRRVYAAADVRMRTLQLPHCPHQ